MARLGAVFRAHGAGYRNRFGSRMSADQLRAMRQLAACHTPALGGVLWECPDCHGQRFTYRSCGNRHCPACGHADAELWLARQQRLLLPATTYHLVTFTVPEALRRVIRSHPREALPILFDAASSTLLDLCREQRFLGGTPGLTAVLHTWTRQLIYHPHVHFLATGGGLDPTGAWRTAHPKFLVPVHALSKVFRARFRDALREALPEVFAAIPVTVWRKDWVVHSKPVGSGEKAQSYLARYLYRVALADSAILRHDEKQVVFRYRDRESGQASTARLEPEEFIRRFLQHVLPRGFRKVRHYGLHHSSKRQALRLIQVQLAFVHGLSVPSAAAPTLPPMPPPVCPHCRIPMWVGGSLRRSPATPGCPEPAEAARGPPA